jgi:transcriptional regulator with XRE-family HTH domain
MGCDGKAAKGPGAGRTMLSGLLRAWRAEAGAKLQRGKALPQKEVAKRMGVSERWYRSLENDLAVSLSADVLDRLADALVLGPDERMALHQHVLGGGALPPDAVDDLSSLTRLVDMPSHLPVYLTDNAWDIVGSTPRMAAWFPWVRRPSANLLRWALTTAEGREQLVDWHQNAEVYLAQLRFALVGSPEDSTLNELLADVLKEPECRKIWDARPRVVAYRQWHRFRLRIPWVSSEEFAVTSQVLLPAYLPGFRYVVLLPCDGEAKAG